jgi:hypothetical protein
MAKVFLPSVPTFGKTVVFLLNKTDLTANIPDINQELIGLCIRGDRVAQYRRAVSILQDNLTKRIYAGQI